MYSGDVPSTSGHHNSQPSFYPHPPPNHHTQGAASSRDGPPPEESRASSSPHYIEMMPMRIANGGGEQIEMMEGGEEQFAVEGLEREEAMGLEGGMGGIVGKTKNGEGGGGTPKMIPMIQKKFKPEVYNIKKNIREFWPMQKQRVEKMSVKYLREASRNQVLPLARVKKIMKIDENVQKQMIAADAPLLLSVASEMFIEELTLRSWEVTEEAKRKTLQKTDVATASTRHEHMDFLIDIIPRTGILPRPKEQMKMGGGGGGQPQMIVRDGGGVPMGQFMKGGTVLTDGGPSTSSQQEFSARLETGEEAQVIQIGKPIPLSSQAISQLGLGPLPPPTAHHPPQHQHQPHQQSHHHQTQHHPPPSHRPIHSHPPPSNHVQFHAPHPPSHPHAHSHSSSHPSLHPSTSSHSHPSTSYSHPSTTFHSHPSTSHSHPSASHSHPSTSHSHPSTSSHSHHQTTVRIPSHLVSTPPYRGKAMPRGGKAGPSRQMNPHPSSSQAGPSSSRTN